MPKTKHKNKQPLVSITMIVHNRKDDVRESLEHVFAIKYSNYEVIVVDNASMDSTPEMIEQEFPLVKVIRLGYNKPLRARNVSFQRAKGEYVVVLDDDSYPEPEAISRMVKRFESDPVLGIVAFQIPCGDYFSTETWRELSAGHTWYIGSGAGIRKEVFEKAGYYDETLGGYAEEPDLSFRALARGYTIGHFKNIVAHHRPRMNKNRFFRFFVQNERNQQYLMGKYVHPFFWLTIYSRSIFYRSLRGYYCGGAKAVLFVLYGHLLGIPYIFKGYFCRINLPAVIQLYIIENIFISTSFFYFIFNKNERDRILAFAWFKHQEHSTCPRVIDSAEISRRLHRWFFPKNLQRLFELRQRLSAVLIRENSAEKVMLMDKLSREVEDALAAANSALAHREPKMRQHWLSRVDKKRALQRLMRIANKIDFV